MSFLTSPEAEGERETRVGVCAAGGPLIREEENGESERKCPALMSINKIKIRTAWKRHFTSLGRREQ